MIMSGLTSSTFCNAGNRPACPETTIMAFIFGSSANELIWLSPVSISVEKFSGRVICLTTPGYFSAIFWAALNSSSLVERVGVTMPMV